MSRPFSKRIGYDILHTLCRLVGVLAFGVRVFDRRLAPTTGPALICANHQSFFDPVLIGLALDVRLNYMARKSLFDVPVLKQLIAYLDAIPIDRDGPGVAGLKETLKRLKRGEQVLIFPEGTRTRNGEMLALKPGFLTLARRTGVPLVPIGFDGAYQAWPRTQKLPGLSQIIVVVGEPITPEQIAGMNDADLIAELESRMRACHTRARNYRQSCQ